MEDLVKDAITTLITGFENNEAELKECFEEVDKDHSGFLDKAELRPLVETFYTSRYKNFYTNKTEEEKEKKVQQAIDFIHEKYDVNKDGQISFDEFKEVLFGLTVQIILKNFTALLMNREAILGGFKKYKEKCPEQEKNMCERTIQYIEKNEKV